MSEEEMLNNLIELARNKGCNDQEILWLFYGMYKDEIINLDDFEKGISYIGFSLTKRFKDLPDDEKKRLDEEGLYHN